MACKHYMLLDRSGSMSTQWEFAIGAINTYVSKIPAEDSVLIALFDSHWQQSNQTIAAKYAWPPQGENFKFEVVFDGTVNQFRPISFTEYSPRGGTPLNQAMFELFNSHVNADNHEKAVIVVMTDGDENSSASEYTTAGVKGLIDVAEKRGYQIVFLGANFDRVNDQASQRGVRGTRALMMTPQNYGATMSLAASKAATYSGASAAAVFTGAATMDFTEQEKKDAIK